MTSPPPEASSSPPDFPFPIWRVPAETAPHAATWMAYGVQRRSWGRHDPRVAHELRTIAVTIAQHSDEEVRVLVRKWELWAVRRAFRRHLKEMKLPEDAFLSGKNPKIRLLPIPNLDDIWMRDTCAVFSVKRVDSGDILGTYDFHFNGWGGKQSHQHDKEIANFVLYFVNKLRLKSLTSSWPPSNIFTDTSICHGLVTSLVLEGGAIEVDGRGTAILSESCIVNPNRNPGMTKEQCEDLLRSDLGVLKIIWLPGNADPYDITDGHIDGYVRFAASPTTLLVAQDHEDMATFQKHMEILRHATNFQNEPFRLVPLKNPTLLPKEARDNPEFCATYVNFYVANGIVLIPQFGDVEADRNALTIVQQEFPNHEVLPILIPGIAAQGGGIHCVTHQQPYVPGFSRGRK